MVRNILYVCSSYAARMYVVPVPFLYTLYDNLLLAIAGVGAYRGR
jgi:hypothetical protein